MKRPRRLALPIPLLASAQLLLPSFGVTHAHDAGDVVLDARAAGRATVHAHGAGLPHDHSFGSMHEGAVGSRRHESKVGAGHDTKASAGHERRASRWHAGKAGKGDDGPARADFRRLGVPTATLRAPFTDWNCAWDEAATPPETSMGGGSRGAAPVATSVFRPQQRRPEGSLGPPLEPAPAAWPHDGLLGTRPLRGPPRCV